MNPGTPTRVIGSTLGLAAFAVAIIAGLAADNPADSVLLRAVISMMVCQALGWLIGSVAERVVTEAVEKYVNNRRVPGAEAEPNAPSGVRS